jgi:hypothetical protein
MTIEAVDTFLRMHAHLVLMHNRVLLLQVTLGAFARRPNECGRGLPGFLAGPRPVDEEGADDQAERDHNGHEHWSK